MRIHNPLNRARLGLLALLPALFADCCGSVLVGESFDNTLSAKAYDVNVNKHPHNAWTRRFIDRMFKWQPDHCKVQWEREQKYEHGVWSAWAADWAAAAPKKD